MASAQSVSSQRYSPASHNMSTSSSALPNNRCSSHMRLGACSNSDAGPTSSPPRVSVHLVKRRIRVYGARARHHRDCLAPVRHWSIFGSDCIRTEAQDSCFGAFSSRKPVFTSLEDAVTLTIAALFPSELMPRPPGTANLASLGQFCILQRLVSFSKANPPSIMTWFL